MMTRVVHDETHLREHKSKKRGVHELPAEIPDQKKNCQRQA
jgi:hypothetical protein